MLSQGLPQWYVACLHAEATSMLAVYTDCTCTDTHAWYALIASCSCCVCGMLVRTQQPFRVTWHHLAVSKTNQPLDTNEQSCIALSAAHGCMVCLACVLSQTNACM